MYISPEINVISIKGEAVMDKECVQFVSKKFMSGFLRIKLDQDHLHALLVSE